MQAGKRRGAADRLVRWFGDKLALFQGKKELHVLHFMPNLQITRKHEWFKIGVSQSLLSVSRLNISQNCMIFNGVWGYCSATVVQCGHYLKETLCSQTSVATKKAQTLNLHDMEPNGNQTVCNPFGLLLWQLLVVSEDVSWVGGPSVWPTTHSHTLLLLSL